MQKAWLRQDHNSMLSCYCQKYPGHEIYRKQGTVFFQQTRYSSFQKKNRVHLWYLANLTEEHMAPG